MTLTQNGFVYGLVAFIIVAALIDQYDNEHGTGYLWLYTLVIGLGFAIGNSQKLSAGLKSASGAANAPAKKAG